jgi:hypothetical protein
MFLEYNNQQSIFQYMNIVIEALRITNHETKNFYLQKVIHQHIYTLHGMIKNNDVAGYNDQILVLITRLNQEAIENQFNNVHILQIIRAIAEYKCGFYELRNCFADYELICIADYEWSDYESGYRKQGVPYVFNNSKTSIESLNETDRDDAVEYDEEFDITDPEIEIELAEIPEIEIIEPQSKIQKFEEFKKPESKVEQSITIQPEIAWKRLSFFMGIIILIGWLALK